MSELYVPRYGILASGGGTTADAFAWALNKGQIPGEVGVVISDHEDAGVFEMVDKWNSEWGFDTQGVTINGDTHPGGQQPRGQTLEESEAIVSALDAHEVDYVLFLGYMRIAGGLLIREYGFDPKVHSSMYQARALNTHPCILPLTADTYDSKDPSRNSYVRTLNAYHNGEISESQHTVHVVAEEVDAGPTVAIHKVPIEPDDTVETLRKRTQQVEKSTIAYAADRFRRGREEYLQQAA